MDHYFYKTVYAPDGTMFEVSPERGAQLVLNKGWSNTPPEKDKPAKKRVAKKAGNSAGANAADTVEVETGAAEVAPVSDE